MMSPHPMKVHFGSHVFEVADGSDFESEVMRQLRMVHDRSVKSFTPPDGCSGSLDPHKFPRWCAATLRHLERQGRVESVTLYTRKFSPTYAEDFGPVCYQYVVKFVA